MDIISFFLLIVFLFLYFLLLRRRRRRCCCTCLPLLLILVSSFLSLSPHYLSRRICRPCNRFRRRLRRRECIRDYDFSGKFCIKYKVALEGCDNTKPTSLRVE